MANISSDRTWVMVKRIDDSESLTIRLVGRDAWALDCLINAGARGCTPLDHPGPRWSHYVWKIKRAGIQVETVTEMHGGQFSGHHARYILRTPLQIVDRSASKDRRAA